MMKPRVIYVDLAEQPCIGRSAKVFTRNHYKPRLTGWVITSAVVRIVPNPTGPQFETRNTVYIPAPTDETNPYIPEAIHAPTI